MKEEAAVPTLLAFLVCDNIVIEAGTGKKTLIGIFDKIVPAQLPILHGPVGVYAKIADAKGKYTFRLELVRLESEKAVGRAVTNEIKLANPLEAHELTFRLPLPIEKYGRYEFQLFANDVWIGRTTFRAMSTPGNKEKPS